MNNEMTELWKSGIGAVTGAAKHNLVKSQRGTRLGQANRAIVEDFGEILTAAAVGMKRVKLVFCWLSESHIQAISITGLIFSTRRSIMERRESRMAQCASILIALTYYERRSFPRQK